MKITVLTLRWIFGLLFIFSGLVKANDPLGLSYKMQEFFEVWGWYALDKYALFLAYAMNVFEIVLGLAVIVGWQLRLFLQWAFLLLIFFTFLTGYAQFSGKIKTCGCFGDCLPLTSLQSFLKDIALLIINAFLLWWCPKISFSTLGKKVGLIYIGIGLCATILFQNHVLKHLPIVDCLAYKKGNNLAELVQKSIASTGINSDKVEIWYTYEKNGRKISFDGNHFPDDFDSTYVFVERKDEIIATAANKQKVEFNLQTLSGNDTTTQVLNAGGWFVLAKDGEFGSDKTIEHITAIAAVAQAKHIPFYIVTAQPNELKQLITSNYAQLLICDATVIKTAARVNPTVLIIDKGVIQEKAALQDFRIQ